MLTSDLAATFRRVQEALEGGGQREVAWADQSMHESTMIGGGIGGVGADTAPAGFTSVLLSI